MTLPNICSRLDLSKTRGDPLSHFRKGNYRAQAKMSLFFHTLRSATGSLYLCVQNSRSLFSGQRNCEQKETLVCLFRVSMACVRKYQKYERSCSPLLSLENWENTRSPLTALSLAVSEQTFADRAKTQLPSNLQRGIVSGMKTRLNNKDKTTVHRVLCLSKIWERTVSCFRESEFSLS